MEFADLLMIPIASVTFGRTYNLTLLGPISSTWNFRNSHIAACSNYMQRGLLQEHTELPVEAVLLPRTLTRFNSRIALYGPLCYYEIWGVEECDDLMIATSVTGNGSQGRTFAGDRELWLMMLVSNAVWVVNLTITNTYPMCNVEPRIFDRHQSGAVEVNLLVHIWDTTCPVPYYLVYKSPLCGLCETNALSQGETYS
jgi:hypothetical protein